MNYHKKKLEIPTMEELKKALSLTGGSADKRGFPADETKAQRIAEDMGLGFNLGNTFDAVPHPDSGLKGGQTETAWGNPYTTRDMIKKLRESGFKTMRLPVTWHPHVSGSGDVIDKDWMARIREVVEWCLDEDMYVILNTHHDILEGFLLPDNDHIERSKEFMKNVWAQISEAFADVTAERLVFESLNEIRVPRTSYEWTPDYSNPDCLDAMRNINDLNDIFVKTVRACGGENEDRCIVLPGYSTSMEGVCWEGFRLPEDIAPGLLMVSAHVYSPAHFTFYLKEGINLTTFDLESEESVKPIDDRLEKLYDCFVAKGIPVLLDEFGTVDKDNDADRLKCIVYTVAKASQLGIRCCYWDNGVYKRYGDGMAVFDRENLELYDEGPVEGMLAAVNMFAK